MKLYTTLLIAVCLLYSHLVSCKCQWEDVVLEAGQYYRWAFRDIYIADYDTNGESVKKIESNDYQYVLRCDNRWFDCDFNIKKCGYQE